MNLAVTVMLIAGIVLVYAAIKGQDPRTVIKGALKRTS